MTDEGRCLYDAGVRLMLAARGSLMECLDDLSLPQFRVLATLARHPDASLADQARLHCVTPPAMSKIVDGLVGRGLIDRQPDAADRRVNRHVLTDAGLDAVRDAKTHVATMFQQRIDALSPDDRAAITAALPAIARLADLQEVTA